VSCGDLQGIWSFTSVFLVVSSGPNGAKAWPFGPKNVDKTWWIVVILWCPSYEWLMRWSVGGLMASRLIL
jgi:hypothetical protein